MTTEIELKYLLLPAQACVTQVNVVEKINQALTGQGYVFNTEQKKLSNYYLDTPELALRQMDMGLRVRGIQRSEQPLYHEQTIKTSGEVIGGLHKRPEYNVDIDDDKVKLALFPDKIWQKDAADVVVLQQAIIRLFNTHFERITWTITQGNSVIELAFDSGTITCDGFDESEVIYEIELELVSGEQQALLVLAQLLLEHLAMRPGRLSKAARGYALAAQYKRAKAEELQSTVAVLVQAKAANNSSIKAMTNKQESMLEIIPSQGLATSAAVFRNGLDFSLTKLQCKIDDYIDNPSLPSLLKINEYLALLRQGFWLFSQVLTTEQLKIRDELSYFIRSLGWLENAQHLQELIQLNSCYRKKLVGSDKLIAQLRREQAKFPSEQDMIELFHSERFNLLQLSLLELLLSEPLKPVQHMEKQQTLLTFAQAKLTFSLEKISTEMLRIEKSSNSDDCASYLEMHGLLVRSLLTGSWFSALFNKSGNEQKPLSYRRPWLDVKQGISELQTLRLLQLQLLELPACDNKILAWLDNKIENLLQAIGQSRIKALSLTPYWQGNF